MWLSVPPYKHYAIYKGGGRLKPKSYLMVKKAVIHTDFVAPCSRLKRNKNRWKRGLIIFASVVQNKISGPGERYVDLTQIFVKKVIIYTKFVVSFYQRNKKGRIDRNTGLQMEPVLRAVGVKIQACSTDLRGTFFENFFFPAKFKPLMSIEHTWDFCQ